MKQGALIKTFLVAAILLASPGLLQAFDRVLRASDGDIIPFYQMVDEVKDADYVFIGELHDRAEHHEAQLTVINALRESGRPVAVGLEMFTAQSQASLDSWVEGKAGIEKFKSLYSESWKQPWYLYREIFLYLRKHKIPMVGLNVPREITRKVAREGFASLTPEELGTLPPGLTCDLDRGYKEYIKEMFKAHGNVEKSFVNFCEAQLLWDKAMAWYLLQYRTRNPERTVVVLSGVTHSLKKGIPEQIQRFSGDATCLVIVPRLPNVTPASITPELADYVLLN